MAQVPVSALTALGGPPASGDLIPVVDVSDPSQGPSGTAKHMTAANLYDNPTFSGTTTVEIVSATGHVVFTANGSSVAGAVYKDATDGMAVRGATGLATDFILYTPNGFSVAVVPTGTRNWKIPVGNLEVTTGTTAVQAFGCNGTTPQTAHAPGSTLASYSSGAFGYVDAAMAANLYANVVAIRAALVACGILSGP